MRSSGIQQYIGRMLARERAALSYKQAEFAKLLGCSQPQYCRYENGERAIPSVTLYELAQHLQVPVERFYPTEGRDDLDQTERELVEAWRAGELKEILRLVGEKFT